MCVDEIESLKDLGKIMITPSCVFHNDTNDFRDQFIMVEKKCEVNLNELCENWWLDENNFTIYDQSIEGSFQMFARLSNKKLGNINWRNYWCDDFYWINYYHKTLGRFSGFPSSGDIKKITSGIIITTAVTAAFGAEA